MDVLEYWLPSCFADRALHDLEYSTQLNAEQFYELVLAATGDEKEASAAASARGWARLRAGLPV